MPTDADADVEAVAEALWRQDSHVLTDDTWAAEVDAHPQAAQHYRDLARAAIEALAARPDDDAAQ